MNYWDPNQKPSQSKPGSKKRLIIGIVFGFLFVGTINLAIYLANQSRKRPESLFHIFDNPENAKTFFDKNKVGFGVKSEAITKEQHWVIQTMPFDSLKIVGEANVTLSLGDKYEITILHHPRLSRSLDHKVENGELFVSAKPSVDSNSSDLNLKITTPKFNKVLSKAGSQVTIENFHGDKLDLYVMEESSITASGTVDHLIINSHFDGKVDTSALSAKTAKVIQSSSQHLKVSVEEKLDLILQGFGDVTCFGDNPEIQKSVSGLGKLFLQPKSK